MEPLGATLSNEPFRMTELDAVLEKEQLEGAGVVAHIAGEPSAGTMPCLSLVMGGVTLYVVDADARLAREVLAAAEGSRRS